MIRPKLGIAYSITGNYVKKTLPSLLSVLENNTKCEEDKQVQLSVFYYIQDIDNNANDDLRDLCNKYNVSLKIIDAQECINALKEAGDQPYLGSFANDIEIVAPNLLDVDYNVLFIECDVVLNHGKSLYELAVYDFDRGKKSCASTIELQDCPAVREVMPLGTGEHIFNCGVFLTSPKLYKEHLAFEQYANSVKEKGWKFYPYWNVLRNAYGLRNELCILPFAYQVYPAQRMLKISQWINMFDINMKDYYKIEEIEKGLQDPIFIHYVNYIVKKPWHRDLPCSYRKEGNWPYQSVWNYYADMLGIRDELLENWDKTYLEKIKRLFYDFLRPVYVWLCTYFYKKEVRSRNNIINNLKDSEREKIMNIK